MSEIRFNPITRDWVIISPDRTNRPNDFVRNRQPKAPRPAWREGCPFCVGNEALTDSDVLRVDDASGAWMIRVVPNKYPFLKPEGAFHRAAQGTFLSISGSGSHEVVIEQPAHHLALADLPQSHLAAILRTYRERYADLRQKPAVESVVIFKNHGERAGTSLEHPHSQIAAVPVVSSQVFLRLEEGRRFFDETGDCLYCQVLRDELEAGDRVLETGEFFVAFVPYAALSPYHMWIYPRRHMSSYDSITDEELDDLARVLGRVLRRLCVALGDPDFNFSIRSAPVRLSVTPYYHWYLAIVPRVSNIAGFEQGIGMYINPQLPERSAEVLRDAVIDP